MNVVQLKPRNTMPADFSADLRALADRVDKGEVTEAVIGVVRDGNYEFVFPSSLADSLVLATLMQARCLERMRIK